MGGSLHFQLAFIRSDDCAVELIVHTRLKVENTVLTRQLERKHDGKHKGKQHHARCEGKEDVRKSE